MFVSSFDGMGGYDWAVRTSEQSQLGASDALFAVAVDDRAYGIAASGDYRLSSDEINDIGVDDVEPHLGDGDWSGAAVALADALHDDGGSALLGFGLLAGGAAVVGGGAYLAFGPRRSRRKAEQKAAADFAAQDPYDGTPTEQLTGRASEELLALDEAVKSSEIDLAYAQAQYGDGPIAGFRDALDTSTAELAQAFALRQQLDDEVPETDREQRTLLARLLALTGAADARLDSQAESYARLRGLEQNAGAELEKLAPRSAALAARLPATDAALAALAASCAPATSATVADNATEARVRLAAADQAIAAGRAEVQAGRSTTAVAPIRAAEDALAQTQTLLDAVDALTAEVAAAPARFDGVLAETRKDLAEAEALRVAGIDTPGLPEQVQRAQEATSAAQALLHPSAGTLPDPLGALRQLADADSGLEAALGPARDAKAARDHALAVLDETMRSARSSIGAAGSYISTRRGSVGSTARTRLSEAERHLAAAVGADDPVVAVAAAKKADTLAQQALDTAQSDVRAEQSSRSSYQYSGAGYGGSGFSSGHSGGGGGGGGGGHSGSGGRF